MHVSKLRNAAVATLVSVGGFWAISTFYGGSGPSPSGSGLVNVVSSVTQAAALTLDAGQAVMFSASAPVVRAAPCYFNVVTSDFDSGTNVLVCQTAETILGANTVHPVYGFSVGTTTTSASPVTMGQILPPQNSLGVWTLQMTGVLLNDGGAGGGWLGGDAGLQDYATWCSQFVTSYVSSQSDGGASLLVASATALQGGCSSSCSGTGCSWSFTANPTSSAIPVIVTGAASETVDWSMELQYAQKQ